MGSQIDSSYIATLVATSASDCLLDVHGEISLAKAAASPLHRWSTQRMCTASGPLDTEHSLRCILHVLSHPSHPKATSAFLFGLGGKGGS